MRNIRFTAAIAALALAIPLAACGSDPAPAEHGEEGAEAEKGPNGGRLLKDGDFAVEVTVFETGQEPQFRVYATRGGEPVDPGAVQLTMILRRLGGEVNTFAFKPEGKFLAGQGVVEEPHSFDVEVVAVENGQRHVWKYASPEGRTRITAEAAKAGGIEIMTAGPATIGETRELFGTVALDPSARSEIRGQFPGRVVSVTKAVGDYVQRGQLLARIESSESLQVYPVYATVSGVVAERNGNPGDVTGDRALYVITDPAQTSVVFNIFPKDLAVIQPGMRVEIEAMDGTPVAASQLGGYLPEGNAEAGTALVRTSVPNRAGRLRAGMALRGKVVVNAVTVPLAVRTEAIQPFRDFKVVFANFGQDYEVRMLELGRSSPEWTEVLSGIKPGTPYAAKGSFLIRADIEKSGASHDH
ncbi:efflux RND transporter periplasmic adaptor subunit [Sphingorhabdus buctiana]|jgi:cobalt-zinc-cadmium efflux system membrane fusion protein|uniref:Efflux RND transporter periplasmic adaptor subunit n=1 Tax=Sphingorhabdus buctiana TaxID=1508805 RepID=A0ABW4ME03_9SPHN|nr:efflux RND transporter periplasmic adaptor subunit [Porphyrobacter sp. LM 6]AOL95475.1 membrane fusion protein, cobalt-zinc-cadmium efflux system [Porphyrobacter sp. LM 6]MCZ8352056.1 efflux RND transporter periplasmic adaptor subunit [Rhizobium sp.]